MPMLRIDGAKSSALSRCKNVFNTLGCMSPTKVIDAIETPGVSENTSTRNPITKHNSNSAQRG